MLTSQIKIFADRLLCLCGSYSDFLNDEDMYQAMMVESLEPGGECRWEPPAWSQRNAGRLELMQPRRDNTDVGVNDTSSSEDLSGLLQAGSVRVSREREREKGAEWRGREREGRQGREFWMYAQRPLLFCVRWLVHFFSIHNQRYSVAQFLLTPCSLKLNSFL